jgi:CP family cyanate transporter-like MFS transporter
MTTPTELRPPIGVRTARKGLLIVGILLIAANLRAGITSVGPLLGEIRADLGLSAVAASALISLPLVAFAVFSPFAPALAAKLGMERTLGLSLLVLMLGIVTRSLPWAPALWIGTVALGLAIAAINVVLPSLLKRDFPRDVGRFTGIYSSVQSAAAATASGIAVPLAGASGGEGWRIALGVWAGLALIALAVFLPQLRNRTLPRHTTAAALDPHPEQYRSPWRTSLGWQVTVLMGMQSTVFYAVLAWWPSIEESHGLSAEAAGWHQFILQICAIAGSLSTAAILHRWRQDQRAIAVGGTVLVAIGVSGELLFPGIPVLWVVLIGMGAGSLIVLALSLFGLRTRHHGQAAALSGMAQSIGYLLAATGPILIGALHDATSDWTAPLQVLLGVLVIQLVAGYLAGRPRQLS